MQKVLLVALAAVTMFTACKKESLTIAPEQELPDHQNVNAEIQRIQSNLQHTTTLGSFQEISRKVSTEIKRPNCQAIPTAVGQGIVVTEVLPKSVKIDYYSFYRFYLEGLLVSSTMQIKTSWLNDRKPHSVSYSFMITSTTNFDELGLAIIHNIEIPKDEMVTFTVTGKNNCGQKSVYEASFIYSSGAARKSSIDETADLLKRTAVLNQNH